VVLGEVAEKDLAEEKDLEAGALMEVNMV